MDGSGKYGKKQFQKVAKINGRESQTPTGMKVNVTARCIGDGRADADVSATDSFLICRKGDGIKVRMFEPTDIDPNRYRYVGKLTITTDEEKESTNTTIANSETDRLQVEQRERDRQTGIESFGGSSGGCGFGSFGC